MNALEIRVIAYVLAALLCMWLGAHLASLHYEALIARDNAAVAATAAQAAMAAKAQQDVADAHNREVVSGLQTQLDAANAVGTDFANRLRNAEARSRVLSTIAGGQPATPASPETGSDRLTGLLGAAATECLQNEARLDALIKEIEPQL